MRRRARHEPSDRDRTRMASAFVDRSGQGIGLVPPNSERLRPGTAAEPPFGGSTLNYDDNIV